MPYILHTEKKGSASANQEATAKGANEASWQGAKPASGVADGRGGGGIRDQSRGQWMISRRLRMAYVPRRLSVGIVQGKSRRRGLGSTARTPRAISCNGEEGEEEKG